MKKSNTAITTFIDLRYLPLEPKYKATVAVLLLLAPVLLFFFISFQPNYQKTTALLDQQGKIEKKLQETKLILQNRPQLLREFDETKAIFEEASKLLPKDKEIPKLTVLGIAPLLGEAMKRIHRNESVSRLFV